MKNEKGITILSLIIYVGVLFIVVMLVGRITGFFYKNADTIENKNSEADFNKLNLYMLEETKKENNRINSLGIMQENGGAYSFTKQEGENGFSAIQFYEEKDEEGTYNVIGKAGNGIYYNKIKICSDVDNFVITSELENGKNKLMMTITFSSGETYNAEYTMRNQEIN